MSKLLFEESWFLELAPRSYFSEADLERVVLSYLTSYLKDYIAIPCKKEVINRINQRLNKPDLAIVKSDYSEWYVIEVELSSHRFDHIEKQVETFSNADYGDDYADYLSKQSESLDQQKMRRMLANHSPKVMVIVNDGNCDWIPQLEMHNCEVSIFQIYSDRDQSYVYRFQGHFPLMRHDWGQCELIAGVSHSVSIIDSEVLESNGVKDNDIIECIYRGQVSQWIRRSSGKRIFLEFQGSVIPLDPVARRYFLWFDEATGLYEFIKS